MQKNNKIVSYLAKSKYLVTDGTSYSNYHSFIRIQMIVETCHKITLLSPKNSKPMGVLKIVHVISLVY